MTVLMDRHRRTLAVTPFVTLQPHPSSGIKYAHTPQLQHHSYAPAYSSDSSTPNDSKSCCPVNTSYTVQLGKSPL